MIFNSNTNPNRRDFIRTATAAAGTVGLANTLDASTSDSQVHFSHGIASGDPLQDRVILWTRALIPSTPSKNISGSWQVSRDASFDDIVVSGQFKTGPAQDHTVKVDASGLTPDNTYYYRFHSEGVYSPTGKTRTLPETTDKINLAVVSCSNYTQGYFNVYKEIANKPFQAVLHLGDYIYEYGVGKYENPEAVKQGRVAKPKTEAVSLEDYRTRYAQYRTDPDLQAAHAAHPFICVWDDHEVANDSWREGAENHTEEEGEYKKRQKAAMQAYREWLPIRETDEVKDCKIYRSFELGQLGTLIMMDTRHIGRDRVLKYENDLPLRTIPFDMKDQGNPKALLSKEDLEKASPDYVKHIPVPFKLSESSATPMTDWEQIKAIDPKKMPKGYSYLPDVDTFHKEVLGIQDRSILGNEQESWMANEIQISAKAGKPWQILGQQLLAGKLGIPQIGDDELDYENSPFITRETMSLFRMLGQMGLPLNLDAWDGYPACRERIFNTISTHANNAVFLAGDTHNAWAFNLKDASGKSVAVELGTPSVSSPGLESYIPAKPHRVAEELKKVSGELQYINNENRGWLELSLTSEQLTAQWQFVSTVISKEYQVVEGANLSVNAGNPTLV